MLLRFSCQKIISMNKQINNHKNVVSGPHLSDMSVMIGGERGRDCLFLGVGKRCDLKWQFISGDHVVWMEWVGDMFEEIWGVETAHTSSVEIDESIGVSSDHFSSERSDCNFHAPFVVSHFRDTFLLGYWSWLWMWMVLCDPVDPIHQGAGRFCPT